jgi:hypothetical protein
MTNVGALAANLHEGSRSEYLAQYIFASFGTAVSVPHQEDVGTDLYCTLTERIGQLAWPRYHYTVQVKSSMSPWVFGSVESVRWLVQHPLPLLLCVLDKSTARLRLYHTFPRFLVWVTGKILPSRLELIPEDTKIGRSTQWQDGASFSLGAPIIDCTIQELLDDAAFNNAKAVLAHWLLEETQSLRRVSMGLPVFGMPHEYETNGLTKGGFIFQWSTLSERFVPAQNTLKEVLPWLAEAYRTSGDLVGAARVALLLRRMTGGQYDSKVSDVGVQYYINKALGLIEPSYVYEGVDKLADLLDKALKSTPASPGAHYSIVRCD